MKLPRWSLETLNDQLGKLPAYAVVEVFYSSGRHLTPRSFRMMARDLPGADRRFTNLDSGTEMFLPLSENLGVVRATIDVEVAE